MCNGLNFSYNLCKKILLNLIIVGKVGNDSNRAVFSFLDNFYPIKITDFKNVDLKIILNSFVNIINIENIFAA